MTVVAGWAADSPLNAFFAEGKPARCGGLFFPQTHPIVYTAEKSRRPSTSSNRFERRRATHRPGALGRRKRFEATSGFHNGRRPSTLLPVLDVREVRPAARAAEPAGRAWNLALPLSGGQSCRSRRRFVTVALAAPAKPRTPTARPRAAGLHPRHSLRTRKVCERRIGSGKRRRFSNAARLHNAERAVCQQGSRRQAERPQGDHSKIIFEDVSVDAYRRLFVDRHSLIVDLRKVPRTIG
jgi:hypothetical protein